MERIILENSVLGSIVWDRTTYEYVKGKLSVNDFTGINKKIYMIIDTLKRTGKECNFNTISDEMVRFGLAKDGQGSDPGLQRLTSIIESAPAEPMLTIDEDIEALCQASNIVPSNVLSPLPIGLMLVGTKKKDSTLTVPTSPKGIGMTLDTNIPEDYDGSDGWVISCKEVMDNKIVIKSLWADFIYPGSIHYIVSETSLGKTTLCYNLALCGANGTEFVDIPFSKKLNVLYADLETSSNLRSMKMNRIATEAPPNFWFMPNLNFITNFNRLRMVVKNRKIDLVVADTVNEVFATLDEDSNSEANRQFAFAKSLRDEFGCSIVFVAHSGKGEQSYSIHKLRGASARAAVSDIVINIEATSDDDVILLNKVKDRINQKDKLYLKKVGNDRFELTEPPEKISNPLEMKAKSFILAQLESGTRLAKDLKSLGQAAGNSERTIDRALASLVANKQISRLGKGEYELVERQESFLEGKVK